MKSRNMRGEGYVARMEEMITAHKNFSRKPKIRNHGNLGMYGRIMMKMNLKEMGYEGTNWIKLAQDRVQWRDGVNK
jgi:hypothetical protein